MATKDLSALPKQLGDVSSKLQEILGLFNSLNGVANQLGSTIQSGFGQTPTSSSVAQSSVDMPMVDPGKASVLDLSGRQISASQQQKLKEDLKSASGSNSVPQSNKSQRIAEPQTQGVFSNNLGIQSPLTNRDFNFNSFMPQQQYGQKDIPRLIADLQGASKLEAKANSEIDRLKSDPNNRGALLGVQSSLKEFSDVTNAIKKLNEELSKTAKDSIEEQRLTKELINKIGEQNRVQGDLTDAIKGSQRINGGGGGGGGFRDFIDRFGGPGRIAGGVLAAAKVAGDVYLGYQQAGLGYGQTVVGGEANLINAQSGAIGYQANRAMQSRNLTNTDNILKYQGDKILGDKLGYMLGDKGHQSALAVAIKEQNDKFDLMKKEHDIGTTGSLLKMGLGLGAIAAAPFTGGGSLLLGGALAAGGGMAAMGGAMDYYQQQNRGQYNLLTGNLEPGKFGYGNEANSARAAFMQERYNETLQRTEELRTQQIEAYKPLIQPGSDMRLGMIQYTRDSVSHLGEYANQINSDSMASWMRNGANVASAEEFAKNYSVKIPGLDGLNKPANFANFDLSQLAASGVVTGTFNELRNRKSGIGLHNAWDLRAAAGSKVNMPFDNATAHKSGNDQVTIRTDADKEGYTYGFQLNHLSNIPDSLNRNKRLKLGESLGLIENSSQPHLDAKAFREREVNGKIQREYLDMAMMKNAMKQVKGFANSGQPAVANQLYDPNFLPLEADYSMFGTKSVLGLNKPILPINPNSPNQSGIPLYADSKYMEGANTSNLATQADNLRLRGDQIQQYAGLVAQTFAPGRIGAGQILGRTTDTINLSRAGLGTVEDLSQNMIALGKANGGRDSVGSLKDVMAAAVAAGFDRSRLGQEFIQTSVELTKAVGGTNTSYMAERLAGASAFGSPFGINERSIGNARAGIQSFAQFTGGSGGTVGGAKMMAAFGAGAKIGETSFFGTNSVEASGMLDEIKRGNISSEGLEYNIQNLMNTRGLSREQATSEAKKQLESVRGGGTAVPLAIMNIISGGRVNKLLDQVKGSTGSARTKAMSELKAAAYTSAEGNIEGGGQMGLQAVYSGLEARGVDLSMSDKAGLAGKIGKGNAAFADKGTDMANEAANRSFATFGEKITDAVNKSNTASAGLFDTIDKKMKNFDSALIGAEIGKAIKEYLNPGSTSQGAKPPETGIQGSVKYP